MTTLISDIFCHLSIIPVIFFVFKDNVKRVRMYDSESDTWSVLPDMKTTRHYHGCGLAVKSDGTSDQAVVAGGTDTQTVEVFDFTLMEWRYFIYI